MTSGARTTARCTDPRRTGMPDARSAGRNGRRLQRRSGRVRNEDVSCRQHRAGMARLISGKYSGQGRRNMNSGCPFVLFEFWVSLCSFLFFSGCPFVLLCSFLCSVLFLLPMASAEHAGLSASALLPRAWIGSEMASSLGVGQAAMNAHELPGIVAPPARQEEAIKNGDVVQDVVALW